MARMLDVCLDEHLVGHLIQDDGGQMSFAYLESWLAQPGAAAFSQSLPLRKKRFPAKECRGFFGGILPEGNKREIIARNLGISARNDYAMLEQIGGECAGAVTFIPARQELPKRDYHYRKKVETRKVEDVEHLQVERYDRKHVTIDGAPGVERLHQEDFCQTQNIVSELKYQKEGGPSFSNASSCYATYRPHQSLILRIFWTPRFSTIHWQQRRARKEFFVHPDKEIRLATLYDAISTIYYPELNTDMAMRIGREYSSDKVTPKDFVQLAGDAGRAKPLVRRRVPELATAAIEAVGKINITEKVSHEVAGLIRKRCTRAGRISRLVRASSTPAPTHTTHRRRKAVFEDAQHLLPST